ncbi:MAG: restriction endonuclease subunit S [Alphaproteobacteria bacterium]|nr:restriction endonuclease subunit S [Alphaproteobacteria bacterium]
MAGRAQIGAGLPSGWAWTHIEEICDVNPQTNIDNVPSTSRVAFVPMAAVGELSGQINVEARRPLSAVAKGFTRFLTGDVIFAKITPCMENGKIAIVPAVPFAIAFGSTEFHVLRPRQGVDSRYVFYYLIQDRFRSDARRSMTGAVGQQRVPTSFVKLAPMPIAPTRNQKRIVAKIDELFGEIEAGEQELEKAREGLEAYRRSLLKAAVTGELTRDWRAKNPQKETGADFLTRILDARHAAWEKREIAKLEAKGQKPKDDAWKRRYVQPQQPDTSGLPELPQGWVWASVDQIAYLIQYGSSEKCGADHPGVPVLRMANLQDGELDYSNLKYLPRNHPEFPDLLLEGGDVVFNRTNSAELVGKTAVYDGAISPCSFASYLIRLKLCGVRPKYFSYFLNSVFGRAWVRSVKSQQVGQANVSGGKLKSLCVPIPPEREQDEIIRAVENGFEAAQEIFRNESTWGMIERFRQSILTTAFSGQLVPQDPSDEPASVLLERLRAAKAVSAEPKRRAAKKSPPRRNARPKQPRSKPLEGIAK